MMLLPVSSIECVLHEECESVCNLYPENGISPTADWMPCLSAPRCLQLYKWFSDILQIMKPRQLWGRGGANNIHILRVSAWSLQESLFELTWGNKQRRKCARIIWEVKQPQEYFWSCAHSPCQQHLGVIWGGWRKFVFIGRQGMSQVCSCFLLPDSI